MVEKAVEKTAQPEKKFPIKALEAFLQSQMTTLRSRAQKLTDGKEMVVAIPSPGHLGFEKQKFWLPIQIDVVRKALAGALKIEDDKRVVVTIMDNDDWANALLHGGENDPPKPLAPNDTGPHASMEGTDPNAPAVKPVQQQISDASETAAKLLYKLRHHGKEDPKKK